MKLSVIVPVYNTAPEDRLKHCLESLEAQTLADMEVIVVDDASTDDSPAVIKEFEERLSKERPGFFKAIYCKENHKQGGARNRGMKIERPNTGIKQTYPDRQSVTEAVL